MMMDQENGLPDGWLIVTLGDIASVIGGGTPSSKEPDNFEDGTIPWITPADLSGYSDKYISHGKRFITEKGLKESSARIMLAGTVLFTSRAPIGYVAIAKNEICTNQGFKSFVINNKNIALSDYVYWWLKGNKDLAESYASGTTFLELSGAKAKQLPIHLAPLPEQHRIVAEIEKQFSRLDEAVAGLKRIQANLKRYRASVLKAAVEGRLTAEWRKQHPYTEPAEQLLQRILNERRAHWEHAELEKMQAAGKPPKDELWKHKYKEPAKPDVSGLPALPEGWVWANVNYVIDEPKYGTSKKCSYESPGIAVLRIPNIIAGSIDVTDLKYAVFSEEEIKAYSLNEGDILIIRSNGSISIVGKCALVTKKEEKYLYAGYLIRLRPYQNINSKYLLNCFYSSFLRNQIEDKAKSTSGVNNINANELKSLVIPICTLDEQTQIVSEVERRLSIADEVEQQININLKRAERLRQSILKKAFSGRLVPQDPDDEPASVLLEKIKQAQCA